MTKVYIIIFTIMASIQTKAQDNLLENLMKSKPDLFGPIIENNEKYEVQLIYTQIDRNKQNKPSFKTFQFNVDQNHYFYPASTVKLPISLLALEKLNKLNISGLNKESSMITGADFEKQTQVQLDSTSQNGLPSIAHYIKKILMVSDNDAYNRLYEFLGQQYINETLQNKGLKDSKITHRLETGMNAIQNAHTNPINFYQEKQLVYAQKSQFNTISNTPNKEIKRGLGYFDSNDILVKSPFEFTHKNKFSLADQHQLLKAIIFPENVKKQQKFKLSEPDYQFIYKYMSQLPSESTFPNYSKSEYWPSYCKFLMFGSNPKTEWPKNIRVFNKVGDAYGFLIDNAYIVDFEKGIEFMVSAIIYCNEDNIYNDNKYDYDTIGLPFMKNIGQLIYDFELKRVKKNKANLSNMIFEYDK